MLQKENYLSQVLLHERAIEILDLRTRALKRLEEAQENVRHYDNASHLQRLGSFWSRSELEWQVKVKERSVSFLTGLYARHSAKICGTLAPVLSSPRHTTATPVGVPELQAANSFGSGFGDFDAPLSSCSIGRIVAIGNTSLEIAGSLTLNQPNCTIDEYHNPNTNSAGYQ